MPGVKVIIANPETRGPCADSHLGEIWVTSEHNSDGYFVLYGSSGAGDTPSISSVPSADSPASVDTFAAMLAAGDAAGTHYVRTGWLGFIRRTDTLKLNGEPQDALYVVGALEESMQLRGLRYHPVDLESTVMRALPEGPGGGAVTVIGSGSGAATAIPVSQPLSVPAGAAIPSCALSYLGPKRACLVECAVFSCCISGADVLCAVVEWEDREGHSDGLDLLPLVTSLLLEEHQLVLGVLIIVDPGTIPFNSRGHKQRNHLREQFLADKLDALYIAYNL